MHRMHAAILHYACVVDNELVHEMLSTQGARRRSGQENQRTENAEDRLQNQENLNRINTQHSATQAATAASSSSSDATFQSQMMGFMQQLTNQQTQAAEIAEQRKFVERFKAKASKARQAQSRVKRIEKIQIERLAETSRRYPKIRFEQRRPSGKEALSVEGLTKTYDDVPVLENVSFTVKRGDRVAIIGPNGIGKSTLLKLLVGEVLADTGEFEWGYEAHPGYFAQDQRAIYGDGSESVLNRLWDTCPERGVAEVRGRLAALLFDRHDVEKRVSSLSGGEMARLGFARLAVEAPNVLILDEPFSGLDPVAVDAMADVLREKTAQGVPVLFSSHQLDLIDRLCDRMVILHKGRMVANGTTEELREVGPRRYRVEARGDLGWLRSLPGLTVVDVDGTTAVIEFPDLNQVDRLLDVIVTELMNRGGLVELTHIRPSLGEIYREAAQS